MNIEDYGIGKNIGFELWDSIEGKMITEKDHNDLCVTLSGEIYSEYDGIIVGRYVKRRYTGLKDKTRTPEFPNGKKIFEGDIVRCSQSGQTMSGVIKDYEGMWGWDFGKSTSWASEAIKKWEGEVIGNIFENPELLDAKI